MGTIEDKEIHSGKGHQEDPSERDFDCCIKFRIIFFSLRLLHILT